MRNIVILLWLCLSSPLLFAQNEGLDVLFSDPGNLTDQQRDQANKFNHTGHRERVKKEGCEANNVNCAPGSDAGKGVKGALEQHMGKAYTMIFGGLGFLTGGIKTKTAVYEKNGNKVELKKGEDGKLEKKERRDYCMYAAIGFEMIALFVQTGLQNKASNQASSIQDIQLRSLVELKKAHEARKKTATMQSVVYSGVSACYLGYLAAGGYLDPWLYAKMGGAVALASRYGIKAKKHTEASKAIQRVIDSLPKDGACNPWTETPCFCSEESSKSLYPGPYTEICILNKGDFNTPMANVPCGTIVDGKMQIDEACKCKLNNSCFNAQVKTFTPNFNVGKNFMDLGNSGFELIGDGSYDHAKLTNYSTSTTAKAKKALDKIKMKLPTPKLTDEQKKLAKELEDILPSQLAALAAAAPESAPPGGLGVGKMASIGKISEENKKKLAQEIKGNYKNNAGPQYAVGHEGDDFKLPTLGQDKGQDHGTEIVTFAEKAINQADVSNATETPIFDIISNRYRRSGWNKLGPVEEK